MASRNFRQRPVDVHRQLDIVRDETLLDSNDGLPIKLENQTKPAQHGKVHGKQPGGHREAPAASNKEIPIPGVTRVPTYDLDYLPVFRERNTYLRGRGGYGYDDPTLVEYDLDIQDLAWLKEFNGDQERLSANKFEGMLWRLDVANAEATDKIYSFGGTTGAERNTAEACATTDYLAREHALQALEETCPSRDTIRVAVYEYWLKKRAQLGAPLLRRLQAPTPLNNNDPYRVFRPREKVHRPQTRRRRENNVDSLDKLNMISDNIKMALQLFELVVKRERKKRDMTYVVTDWQQLQIKQRHDPRSEQDTVEQEYQNAAKSKNVRRPVGFEKLPEAAPAATNALLDFRNKKNKKRKKLGFEPQLNAVAQLGPPPFPPQPHMVFSVAAEGITMNAEQGKLAMPSAAKESTRPRVLRIGRGGRLIVDRCRSFTWDPLDGDGGSDEVQPMHTMPNPYAQWTSKGELAQAALARLDGGAMPSTVVKLRLTPVPAPNAAALADGPAAAEPSPPADDAGKAAS